jgi:predicted amidohydrolase
MQNLKITLVQAEQSWEQKQANLNHYEALLQSIEVTDIVVLPEMFHTGFTMNAVELAEEGEDGVALTWLKKMSKAKNAAFYTSYIAKEDEFYFNRGVFVEPNGRITHYDKRKLFTLASEEKTYKAGKVKSRILYKGWKIQFQICYDLRFPEISRNGMVDHKSAKFDVLIYVANWPERRNSHWKSLLQARAIENQCYVVGVNRVGVDGKELTYSGDSAVYNANGSMISNIESFQEIVQIVELDYKDLTEFRSQLAFLKDV